MIVVMVMIDDYDGQDGIQMGLIINMITDCDDNNDDNESNAKRCESHQPWIFVRKQIHDGTIHDQRQ